MIKMILASVLLLVNSLSCGAIAPKKIELNTECLNVGDYIVLGRYGGENIVWRYVADDENGKLMWSDEFICKKPFGESNSWENSWIRTWLNSSREVNNVSDMSSVDPLEQLYEEYYKNESGFIHSDNFSQSEISVIKTVMLKTPAPKIEGWTLPTEYAYKCGYKEAYCDKEELEKSRDYYSKLESIILPENIFLLDFEQLLMIQNNSSILGDCFKNIVCINEPISDSSRYWIRTPIDGVMVTSVQSGTGEYYKHTLAVDNYSYGDDAEKRDFCISSNNRCTYSNFIRPAFYLNEENAQILSGSGTKDAPYVLDGKPVPERFEENGLYGYKDADGNVVVPAKYAKALPFSDGAALVATVEDPYRWRYIGTNGNYLFDKAFYASNNFNNGYALVLVADDPKYTYIDKTGEFATELLFDDAEDFYGGYARVQIDGKWGVVDTNFNFKVPCKYDNKDEVLGKLDLS